MTGLTAASNPAIIVATRSLVPPLRPEIIRENAGMMAHFHANDANRRGPGMGQIDFLPILQTLRDIGYQGWVSVEVFDYEPGVESLARDSIRYLRQCVQELDGG